MSFNFSSAISGIQSVLGTQALRANNIANINTNGYKSKQPHVISAGQGLPETKSSILYTQGPLSATGNPADITVIGSDFIELESPEGKTVHARSINLQIDASGRLTDGQGNILRGVTGDITNIESLTVREDGTLFATDGRGQIVEVGKLLLSTKGDGQAGFINDPKRVLQGFQESSNVDLAENITGQMLDEKVLKANIVSIKVKDEMLGDIIDLKG